MGPAWSASAGQWTERRPLRGFGVAAQREVALLLGPPGTGKSHLAQAIGRAAIQQGITSTWTWAIGCRSEHR